MTYEVYLSIGSNIEPRENVTDTLKRIGTFTVIDAVSRVYLTKPIQVEPGADNFHNFCVRVRTGSRPSPLKERLRDLEEAVGRERTIAESDLHSSRAVDVDILLYEPAPEGFEPHPQIYDEAFVVYPLSDILDPAGRKRLPESVEAWRQGVDGETILDTVSYEWPPEIEAEIAPD